MPTGLRITLHVLQGVCLAAAAFGGLWGFVFITTTESEIGSFDMAMINILILSALVSIGLSPALWSVRRGGVPHQPTAPPVHQPQPPQYNPAAQQGPPPGRQQEWPPR